MLSESELYLKVVPMDWIIFFVILGYLKRLDIRHAFHLILPSLISFSQFDSEASQRVIILNPKWHWHHFYFSFFCFVVDHKNYIDNISETSFKIKVNSEHMNICRD